MNYLIEFIMILCYNRHNGECMKIIKSYPEYMKIEIVNSYDLKAEVGSNRDSDVYARMCGLENNLCVVRLTINDLLILELCSQGEQKIDIGDSYSGELTDALMSANRYKLTDENQRTLVLDELAKNNISFDSNSWFEARILYKSMDRVWESDIGLSGVWESVDHFLEYFANQDQMASYVSWLDEEIDNY